MPDNKKAAGCLTTATALENQMHRESSRKSTATAVQLDRMVEKLRLRPHHTHELRKDGISHPAGRVLDLQKMGFTIESSRTTTVDSDGFVHVNVALYSLVGEPELTQ